RHTRSKRDWSSDVCSSDLITYKRNKQVRDSNEEYYLGGKGLSVMVLFFTFYATQYSGNNIIGYAPEGYRAGFEWLQSITFMVLVIVGYLLFAPRLYVLSRKFEFITPDRKSTRLNSSHVSISYAVFCLKKKKTKKH